MIKKILFATDLGTYAVHSLLHVESLAKQFDAEVHVVHAVPPIGEFTAAVVRSYCSDVVKQEILQSSHLKGLLEALREQVFETLARDPFDQVGFIRLVKDIIVLPGNPAVIVLAEAERLEADLIVVGSHTAETIDGRLLGSVATKILQLAKVPVFMVPMINPAHYVSGSGSGGSSYRA